MKTIEKQCYCKCGCTAWSMSHCVADKGEVCEKCEYSLVNTSVYKRAHAELKALYDELGETTFNVMVYSIAEGENK